MYDLGTLGGQFSYGTGINDVGQAVGRSATATGEVHAFVHPAPGDPGTQMIDVGTLGGTYSEAWDINVAGQVIGTSSLVGLAGRRAFISDGATMVDLGTLGGGQSEGLAINTRGVAVGSSLTATRDPHAFVHADGTMFDLNDLVVSQVGAVFWNAVAINDRGAILACW